MVSSERLEAAKAVAPLEEAAAVGLAHNYPNPFNSSTRIVYRLGRDGPVRLEIYNTLGQPLRTLVDEVSDRGRLPGALGRPRPGAEPRWPRGST